MPAIAEPVFERRHDFSLVLGGPIFQLFRKSHLSGDALDLLHRRLLIITGVAWLPMLVLALLASTPGGGGRVSFFQDVEVQTRFLVALPILIAAELIVHRRIRLAVRRFVDRRIVLPQDLRGLVGVSSYGKNDSYNTPSWKNTVTSEFDVSGVMKLPRADILYAYVDMPPDLI
jgi:hypothetical protein